jgi:hypothetical protein
VPGAHVLGPEILESALQQEDQAHHHPDQNHGKRLAHTFLHALDFLQGPERFMEKSRIASQTRKSIPQLANRMQ